MNQQEKLKRKRQKLQVLEEYLKEEIESQVKYLDYCERKMKLETDIKELENLITSKKIWIDIGNGWRKRISKNE